MGRVAVNGQIVGMDDACGGRDSPGLSFISCLLNEKMTSSFAILNEDRGGRVGFSLHKSSF